MSRSDKSKDNNAKGMTRRVFLQTAGIATLAAGSGATSLTPGKAQAKQTPTEKPNPSGSINSKQYNVLFIMTDQQRYLPDIAGVDWSVNPSALKSML